MVNSVAESTLVYEKHVENTCIEAKYLHVNVVDN